MKRANYIGAPPRPEPAALLFALASLRADGDALNLTLDSEIRRWYAVVASLDEPPWKGGAHCGDCTKVASTCNRCVVEEYREMAAILAEHDPAELRAEVERLTSETEDWVEGACEGVVEAEIDHLRAEVERLTRERDDWRDQCHMDRASLESALIAAHEKCDAARAQAAAESARAERLGRIAGVTADDLPATDALAQHDAALLAPVWEKVRASGIGLSCTDLSDAVAQVAQVAVSARDNCAKMEALLVRVRPVIEAAQTLLAVGAAAAVRHEPNVSCPWCALRAAITAYDAGEKGPGRR